MSVILLLLQLMKQAGCLGAAYFLKCLAFSCSTKEKSLRCLVLSLLWKISFRAFFALTPTADKFDANGNAFLSVKVYSLHRDLLQLLFCNNNGKARGWKESKKRKQVFCNIVKTWQRTNCINFIKTGRKPGRMQEKKKRNKAKQN